MISRPLSGWQARTTCSTSERPPARCNTFASVDFKRVPLPAARITMTTSEFDMPTLSAVHADLTMKGDTAGCQWSTLCDASHGSLTKGHGGAVPLHGSYAPCRLEMCLTGFRPVGARHCRAHSDADGNALNFEFRCNEECQEVPNLRL